TFTGCIRRKRWTCGPPPIWCPSPGSSRRWWPGAGSRSTRPFSSGDSVNRALAGEGRRFFFEATSISGNRIDPSRFFLRFPPPGADDCPGDCAYCRSEACWLQGGWDVLTIPVDRCTQLRLLEMSHAQAMFRLVASNRDHLRPWLPWVDRMRVESDAENYILRSLGRFSAGTEAHFGIWFREMLAGSITVERIDAWNRVAEIGYWLGKEFVGKGIMRRSAAALIDYLIEKRAINRIEI